jgi:hypothetical protein
MDDDHQTRPKRNKRRGSESLCLLLCTAAEECLFGSASEGAGSAENGQLCLNRFAPIFEWRMKSFVHRLRLWLLKGRL